MSKHKDQFMEITPVYQRLRKVMIDTLVKLFDDGAIDLFYLDGRVKDVDSFMEKIERKKYSDPFNEVEDICGIRVICYYASDLNLIESIINNEFTVLSSSDKQKESGDDRFGYLSRHYVVILKEQWLHSPLYRGFKKLKVEIQVRTILMHTWAAISHKLMYKKESDAPAEINRKLNRLSALIELADEQFDSIRIVKNERMAMIKKAEIYEDVDLTPDSLISLVNKYSPDRNYESDSVRKFLDEIEGLGITEKYFDNALKENIIIIEAMEKETAQLHGSESYPYWGVPGFCRASLDLVNDDYFKWRWSNNGDAGGILELKKMRTKYRKIAKDSKKSIG